MHGYNILVPEGNIPLGDLNVDGRIILKCILRKKRVKM
jgi:hypothetical protein